MNISNVDNQETARQLTTGVANNIQGQIQNEIISVSKLKMDINPIIERQKSLPKTKNLHKTQHREPNIEKLHQIKQAKMTEIRQLQQQEDMLKRSAVLSKCKLSKSCIKLWRSEFTQQEMNQIKKIKKKQRHYQRQLKKKENGLENWLEEKRLQDEQLKKKFVTQLCGQRRKELIKQRQQLQKKKKQRQLLLQEEIKNMKQNRHKKLLHHQMVQSWKKYQEAIQAEKSKTLAVHKERLRVDSKIIQEHQAKYLQLKKDQQKKRQKALEQSRSAQLHLPYIRNQIFYKVKKEEQEKARLEKMKTDEIQNNVIKKKQYGKLVIDQFLPKIKQHSTSKEKEGQKQMTKAILSVQESYKLGNNYMRSVHQKITNEHVQKQKNPLKTNEQAGGNSVFYKNYLKQLKSQHLKQNKPTPHAIVYETMNNNKLSEIDKLHKVRMVLDKDTGIKKSDSDMVEILKSKIKVLNQIMH